MSIADNGGGGPVRGKMLSYNTGRKVTSGVMDAGPRPPGGPGGALVGSARKTSTYLLSPPASLLDMNIQGRTTASIATAPSGTRAVGGKQGGGGATSIGTTDGQSQSYFLSNSKGNSDLEPLSAEIPTDGVVFARSRNSPSSLVVFRTQEEKVRNPERLNLDRRQLDVCPLLKNEQRLRLLNYQNNNIRTISNLENLPNLIFLDLYNNKLKGMDGPLSTLRGLRVLMIGKNRISEISNLGQLKKLDVLDLHSNDISEINGLDGLTDLRVLNLAGNRYAQLCTLTHATLRRVFTCRRSRI
jgi:Leucine-rich repeat (LRR) protein